MQLVQEQLVLQQLEVLQLQQLEQLQLLLVAPTATNPLTSGACLISKVSKYSACSCFLSSAAFFSFSTSNRGLGVPTGASRTSLGWVVFLERAYCLFAIDVPAPSFLRLRAPDIIRVSSGTATLSCAQFSSDLHQRHLTRNP
jgi:hypothetical protein